jgi:glutamate synthase domain-containing protein 2
MTEDCISPATNPECRSPKELLNFVQKLRDLSGGKPVGFKLCIGNPAEFLSICKAMLETGITPDFITIDGAEGGTGAAPIEFSNRLGMMCLEAVYLVHNALIGVGLRDKIRIIASGKTASSFDLLTKLAIGADAVNAARTMMMAIGCVQSRHCNTNLCPTGIATQDPVRAKAVNVLEKSERIKNFHHNTLKNFYELVGGIGLDDPAKLMPNMIKRRTSNGLLTPVSTLVPTLAPEVLVNSGNANDKPLAAPWHDWWMNSSADSFYVPDQLSAHTAVIEIKTETVEAENKPS